MSGVGSRIDVHRRLMDSFSMAEERDVRHSDSDVSVEQERW